MTEIISQAANAKLLLSEIKRDATCLLVQMDTLDEALRGTVGPGYLVSVTQAVHRSSELVVSLFCERAEELVPLMRGSDQAWRLANDLSVDALDISAGIGLLRLVLSKPKASEFRQSIDFCQTSLRTSLCAFLVKLGKVSRAFSTQAGN